jgi:hypothetical protein
MSSGSIRRRRGEALLLTRWGGAVTTETHKLSPRFWPADVVGFSRLTGTDEKRMSRG